MLLQIADTRTIGDIRDQFQKCFPRLRMDIYKKWKHGKERMCIPDSELLSGVRNRHVPDILEIKGDFKITDIIHQLKSRYDLEISIFRLHENQWMPVLKEEHLSFREACELAEVSCDKNAFIIDQVCNK
jgi:hypothetical protein